MEPKDPGKLFSEANRNLAKAVLILGFKALDSIQQVGTQTQELVQDLVKEAQADIAANKAKEEEAKSSEVNEPPRDINIEVPINEEISVETNDILKNEGENLQESEP